MNNYAVIIFVNNERSNITNILLRFINKTALQYTHGHTDKLSSVGNDN